MGVLDKAKGFFGRQPKQADIDQSIGDKDKISPLDLPVFEQGENIKMVFLMFRVRACA